MKQLTLGVLMFQFHTGSIKSNSGAGAAFRFGAFQFHTGSIKSQAGKKLSEYHQCFNSILVRLKVPVKTSTKTLLTSVSIPYWFD